MENLAKACLDYSVRVAEISPKVYTFNEYAAAVLFMAFSVIGMLWCMHKLCEFIVEWCIPGAVSLYWRTKEAYLFWRYPEPTPEQEAELWASWPTDDGLDYDERVRRDAEIIRRNADRW